MLPVKEPRQWIPYGKPNWWLLDINLLGTKGWLQVFSQGTWQVYFLWHNSMFGHTFLAPMDTTMLDSSKVYRAKLAQCCNTSWWLRSKILESCTGNVQKSNDKPMRVNHMFSYDVFLTNLRWKFFFLAAQISNLVLSIFVGGTCGTPAVTFGGVQALKFEKSRCNNQEYFELTALGHGQPPNQKTEGF